MYDVLNILPIFSLHYTFTQDFTNIFPIFCRHFAYNFPTFPLNLSSFFLAFGQHLANILFSLNFPNFFLTFYQHFAYIFPTLYQHSPKIFPTYCQEYFAEIFRTFCIHFANILPIPSLHFDNFAIMNEIMYRAQKDLNCVRLSIKEE